MNINKILLKRINLFLFIIVIILTSLSFAGTEKKLSDIVCERIDTMEDFYRQEITYNEAINRLSRIEKGRLLWDDMDNLLLYYRTDLDSIEDYEISNIKITSQDSSIICAEMNIMFKIQGMGDTFYVHRENEKHCYSLIFEKCEGKLYLVQFIML